MSVPARPVAEAKEAKLVVRRLNSGIRRRGKVIAVRARVARVAETVDLSGRVSAAPADVVRATAIGARRRVGRPGMEIVGLAGLDRAAMAIAGPAAPTLGGACRR